MENVPLMTVFPIPLGPAFPILLGSRKRKNHYLGQHWSERKEGVHLVARTGNRETFTWQSLENVPSNDSFLILLAQFFRFR